jgi:hypothetical protein
MIQSCNPGFNDCDMSPANGCEINTQTNPADCGNCGSVCTVPNATPACVNGMCAVGTCNMGYTDCDGMVSNGCETNTGADTSNCGTCMHVCALPNAAQSCNNGLCTIGACNNGYANCNNTQSDGCEIDTNTDPLNCGACNKQCFVANGTAGCMNGMCTVASCNPGFADCNGFAQDGCETPTTTNQNCGTCGNNCNTACEGNVTGVQCVNGTTCEITGCAGGYFDIDGMCSDGCECVSKGTSASCSNPTALGMLGVGQSTSYTGNLVPAGEEAWLIITFSGDPVHNLGYHPNVTLTTGASEFIFDIQSDCNGTLESCGVEGGSSHAVTEWEVSYQGLPDSNQPNDSPNNWNPIPAVGNNGAVLIHVYRVPGMPVTCNNYTLSISG